MYTLYPPIEPLNQHRVQVDSVHTLYFEQSGNLAGIPVLFIHGGPGAGSTEKHRRYFDPTLYHIINFDQRGCNRSTPQGSVRNNSTEELLADIELIRERLGLEQWLIFGGSWGSTLCLLYAEAFPQRVTGMILRGVFLARQCDQDWFFQNGVNRLFPEAWDKFRNFITLAEQHNLVRAYYEIVHHEQAEFSRAAASHWASWTGTVVGWMLDSSDYPIDMDRVLNEVRIETHYARHNYFIEENQILDRITQVPNVPTTIIHGRRDLTCTLDASWALHQSLPGSELVIVRDGGHLASEPVMINALIQATNTMARRIPA